MSENKTDYNTPAIRLTIEEAIAEKKRELQTLEQARDYMLAMRQPLIMEMRISMASGPATPEERSPATPEETGIGDECKADVPKPETSEAPEAPAKWPPPKPAGTLPLIASKFKVCPECGHTPRPIEAFGKDKSRPDGHARLCLLHARKARNQYNKAAKKATTATKTTTKTRRK